MHCYIFTQATNSVKRNFNVIGKEIYSLFCYFHSKRLQKQITELEEELKNTQEDLESLAQEREETVDQYEERIVELENEVSKLSIDHEEELQQVTYYAQDDHLKCALSTQYRLY